VFQCPVRVILPLLEHVMQKMQAAAAAAAATAAAKVSGKVRPRGF